MNGRLLPPGIAALVLLLASPTVGGAQPFPAFGGIEARLGVAAPENADAGASLAVDLDLGSLGIGSLRTLAGFHHFAVNRNVGTGGDAGSYTATGGRLGLRLHLFGTRRFSPYVLAALTGHSVDAEVPDEQMQRLLEGFYAGVSAGAGVSFALDEAGRFALSAEARRTLASNIDHNAFELGLRLLPRGARSFQRAARQQDPWLTAERERQEVERRRLAEERAATERARAEQDRLAAERTRAEQERLARMSEEERRRAAEEVERAEWEAEQARQRAAAAEQARRAEAEARAQAERAAAEAAAREQAAARAAREAEQRAVEAERRLYESLLDLERLIANVTGIRETERGLAVVVGQGLFATGQSSLSPPAREEVSRIAAVLRQFPEHRISVEGHTDSVGSEVGNQRLSEQRAESVRAALIAEGVDPGRVDAVGFGQNRPIAENRTAEGRAQNRRVEIVVLGARRPTGP